MKHYCMETEKLFEKHSHQEHQFLDIVHAQATRMENVCIIITYGWK